MYKPFPLRFSKGSSAVARELADRDELAGAVRGVHPPRPVLVLVGGADSLEQAVAQRIAAMFGDRLIPLLEHLGAAVIDGGTDAGIMATIGQARAAAGAFFPLIGVAARGTVRMPGDAPPPHTALEPNHTHFLLVPGDNWGDESPWISAAAAALADGAPSATLAAGGGKITRRDVRLSVKIRRPTLLLAGSGGATDAIARALRREELAAFGIDEQQSGLLRATDCTGVSTLLAELLDGSRPV